jgi:rubrerythrin
MLNQTESETTLAAPAEARVYNFERQRWTEDEDRLLIDAFERGDSDETIAEVLGRTAVAVKYRRIGMGYTSHPRWSRANDRDLRALWAANTPIAEVAAKLNRSEAAVSYRVRRIKAKRRPVVPTQLPLAPAAHTVPRAPAVLEDDVLRLAEKYRQAEVAKQAQSAAQSRTGWICPVCNMGCSPTAVACPRCDRQ